MYTTVMLGYVYQCFQLYNSYIKCISQPYRESVFFSDHK